MRNILIVVMLVLGCAGCEGEPDLKHQDGAHVKHKLSNKHGVLAYHEYAPPDPCAANRRYTGVVTIVMVDASGTRVSEQWFESECDLYNPAEYPK